MTNTSDGMNILADLVAGDGPVLSDELEFPTVTLPFIQTGKKAVEGEIAPTGALIVAEELPADFPTKAVSSDFVKRYEAAFGPNSRNAFAGYSYDGALVLVALPADFTEKPFDPLAEMPMGGSRARTR